MPEVLNDEDWQVLAEAFALIDSYDDVTSEEGGCSDGPTSKISGQAKENGQRVNSKKKSAPLHSITAAVAPKKKRIRRAETSSTAFQRRKKFELVFLRKEVKTLETQLSNLKLKNQKIWESYLARNKLTGSHTKEFTWCEEVLKQYRKRVEAENLNRELKAVVTRHTDVASAIQTVVQEQDALYVSTSKYYSTSIEKIVLTFRCF
ncbi:hypothetical protein PHMEG_00024686 [Phytophthora megakarya]|uniref:Uncharacterized protein n=1 Tax=Phytophthora megakarya TaxID=4795 RepID=A0A225VDH2_9STRA|nr:hypothetical protein PHMEG_00024686 [Phytophthora megakarya]